MAIVCKQEKEFLSGVIFWLVIYGSVSGQCPDRFRLCGKGSVFSGIFQKKPPAGKTVNELLGMNYYKQLPLRLFNSCLWMLDCCIELPEGRNIMPVKDIKRSNGIVNATQPCRHH